MSALPSSEPARAPSVPDVLRWVGDRRLAVLLADEHAGRLGGAAPREAGV